MYEGHHHNKSMIFIFIFFFSRGGLGSEDRCINRNEQNLTGARTDGCYTVQYDDNMLCVIRAQSRTLSKILLRISIYAFVYNTRVRKSHGLEIYPFRIICSVSNPGPA